MRQNKGFKAVTKWSTFLSAVLLCSWLGSCVSVAEENAPLEAQDAKMTELMGDAAHAKPFVPVIGKRGGKRTISSTSLPKTFNAYLAAETSSTDVIGQMYLGLVTTNPVTTEIEPSLAESWTIAPDKMTYTFKLRSGLKWSDGKPITADDVVFTYKDIVDNKLIPNNYRDGLLIEDIFPQVRKVDDLRVQFVTPKPFVPFLRGLSDPIMPKHIFKGTTQPGADGKVLFNSMWGLNSDVKEIVVSGPWKIKSYSAGQHVVLEPNPNYYQKDKNGGALPYLSQFDTIEVQDLNTTVLKFKAGETDSLSMRAEDYDSILEIQKERNLAIKNLGPATGTLFVMFNMSTATNDKGEPVVNPTKTKWFRNKLFRQALAHAIDKQGMNQSIYRGRSIPQNSHISQLNPFYKANVKTYPYDLERAAQLLEEAGFTKKNGLLYDSDGNHVEFKLVTNSGNTQRDAACAILRKDWGKLGITVNYKPVQFNIMVQQIDQTLDWEAMMIGLTGSAIEPHFGINTWKLDGRMHMFNMGHPAEWKGKSGTDFSDWEKEMLALYEKAAVEFDHEKRKEIYWQSQDLASEQLPFLYTVNQLALIAYSNEIGNVRATIHGGSALNQINWNTDYHFMQ